MKTYTTENQENQEYINARLLMMSCEKIGKIITLEQALKMNDW